MYKRQQFKLDAVQYYQDHKDLGVRGCAENLGIGYSTLTKWLKDFRESGDIPVRGSGKCTNTAELQEELGVSRRTLRMDIAYLKRVYPDKLITHRGRYTGGLEWVE